MASLYNLAINLIFASLTPSYNPCQKTKWCKTRRTTFRAGTSSTHAWALLHVPSSTQTVIMRSPHPYADYIAEMLSVE